MRHTVALWTVLWLAMFIDPTATSDHPDGSEDEPWTLRRLDGPSPARRVVESLHGTVMAGYQGWFAAPGDPSGMGFFHWGPVGVDPPRCTVDMWPDLSEYDPRHLYETGLRHDDGSPAMVFSSADRSTVRLHFRWMDEYGIDGVFVQRFTVALSPDDPTRPRDRHRNIVLQHARDAANEFGRAFAVMYDTNFDRAACEMIIADWTRLRRDMGIAETNAYLHHAGGPVVALWGFGFEHRRFDAQAVDELFAFLTAAEQGGCRIMLGLPNHWASWEDERQELIDRYATVISPWNVGRYRDAETADAHFERHWPRDLARCREIGADYYPVVFPGFSWHNLKGGQALLDQIPRRSGAFFWHQIERVRDYGMDMIYIAMFDEVDEGTAIFKVTSDPPVGEFVTYGQRSTDHYLRLAGDARRHLNGEEVTPQITPHTENE